MNISRLLDPWPARVSASLLTVLLLFGCASPPEGDAEAQAAYDEINDPIEPLNRAIFSFNQFADGILIKPLALAYRTFVPPEPREGVHNFLTNLRAPIVLANDLMQGEFDRAVITVERFAINSTAGLGGLFDVAAKFGIEGHREDFGQTLSVWGSGEGPFLMLPLLGPSNPRDVTGLVVDGFIDPVPYFVSSDVQLARTLLRAADERERVLDALDEIERTSLDFYATLRSLYRQRRADEIRNGAPAPVVPIPAISIEEFEEFEDTAEGQVSMVN